MAKKPTPEEFMKNIDKLPIPEKHGISLVTMRATNAVRDAITKAFEENFADPEFNDLDFIKGICYWYQIKELLAAYGLKVLIYDKDWKKKKAAREKEDK